MSESCMLTSNCDLRGIRVGAVTAQHAGWPAAAAAAHAVLTHFVLLLLLLNHGVLNHAGQRRQLMFHLAHPVTKRSKDKFKLRPMMNFIRSMSRHGTHTYKNTNTENTALKINNEYLN